MARPSDYTEELALHICAELASGRSLVSICKDDDMPDISTVYRWRLAHPAFRDMYTRAREDQADTLADEIVGIADESINDTYLDSDGNERTNHEVVARSKLRVDARKWVAAKLKPRSYGDKLDLTHSGELNVKTLSDDDLDKRIAEAAGKAGIAFAADGEGEAEV
jgi:hypothetical protein